MPPLRAACIGCAVVVMGYLRQLQSARSGRMSFYENSLTLLRVPYKHEPTYEELLQTFELANTRVGGFDSFWIVHKWGIPSGVLPSSRQRRNPRMQATVRTEGRKFGRRQELPNVGKGYVSKDL